MMIERPISIAALAMGAALAWPECDKLYRQAAYVPGPALLIGSFVGAFGIFLRTALAADQESRTGGLSLAGWIIAAAAISFADFVGTLRQSGLAWQIVFAGAGLMAMAAPALVVCRLWRDARSSGSKRI